MALVEALGLLLGVLVLVVVIGIAAGWFGERATGRRVPPSVAVVRLTGYEDGHEEVHLLVNEQAIRRVTDEGARSEEYQAQIEELEKLASSLAAALGVEVWLRRADVRRKP